MALAGVRPVRSLYTREKLRRLIFACSARRSTVSSGSPRFSVSHRCSSSKAELSWVCNCNKVLYCACPPGRLRYTTSSRAACMLMSRPQSASTSASARSMPAVTPAEVQTAPCWMKIASASTSRAGKRCCSVSHMAQWVAARQPSSSPALASRKAPLHTEAIRRTSGAESFSHVVSSSWQSRVSQMSGAPGTIRVSTAARSSSPRTLVSTANPSTVLTNPPRKLAVSSW
ncbi:hypothetical protein D3C81_1529090 [compost metagenome]